MDPTFTSIFKTLIQITLFHIRLLHDTKSSRFLSLYSIPCKYVIYQQKTLEMFESVTILLRILEIITNLSV